MLENQADPVRVHPPVPDGEVKTAHRLPKLGKDGVSEVLRVEHRGSRAARGCIQGHPVLDRVWDCVVGGVGGEGVQVDEQLVSLREVLQHEVEPLDHRHPVVARELLVPLADQVVEDVVRTFN